jgi:uncharacterized membrane protein YgcG
MWSAIQSFNFDHPQSEYSFSTRLASENNWTENFTAKAITEYKKFMYLATTANVMVSPSEIVDEVWHCHLLFTQSYDSFCDLLGKKIEHVPSTHSWEDFQKFAVAKERTTKLYEENFGKQPADIWNTPHMLDGLMLQQSKWKIKPLIITAVLVWAVLLLPLRILLYPVYIHIDNPYFLIGFGCLVVVSFLTLNTYNRNKMTAFLNSWDKELFMFHLTPFEMIFLEKQHLRFVVHTFIDRMIKAEKIAIDAQKNFTKTWFTKGENDKECAVLNVLESNSTVNYEVLLHALMQKPAFRNIGDSMLAFKKHFQQSTFYIRLFAVNFIVIATLFALGLTRWIIGIDRDKPVVLIGGLLIVLFFCTSIFLTYLADRFTTVTLPGYYRSYILPGLSENNQPQWDYFLYGSVVLTTVLAPMVLTAEEIYNHSSSSDSGGSSCGSSCGSGGGSCGGCGGGD